MNRKEQLALGGDQAPLKKFLYDKTHILGIWILNYILKNNFFFKIYVKCLSKQKLQCVQGRTSKCTQGYHTN